jgi:hemolysin III
MYPGERFNSISHLVGACLALVGTVVLIVLASLHGDARKIVSLSIYSVSLLALYTFSTLYHSLKGRAKRVFRHLDHTAIYLLIAGSYTPLTLVVLGGRLGWALFAAVWALAVIGIVQEFRKVKGERVLSVVIYVTMGWNGRLRRAPQWRGLLYGRDRLLRARSPLARVSRNLAPLRARRQHRPLPRRPGLRDVRSSGKPAAGRIPVAKWAE